MSATTKPRRGIATIEDLRARSTVAANGCWIWTGPTVHDQPRMWSVHVDMLKKCVVTGPRAVWYIAHGTKLGDKVAYMGCWTPRCVCPVHVRAASRAEMMGKLAKSEAFQRSPAHLAACRRNVALARAAAGIKDTPPELVQAVRDALGHDSQAAIARRLGLAQNVVSRIARGVTFRQPAGSRAC